jgi:hypothetical protein
MSILCTIMILSLGFSFCLQTPKKKPKKKVSFNTEVLDLKGNLYKSMFIQDTQIERIKPKKPK